MQKDSSIACRIEGERSQGYSRTRLIFDILVKVYKNRIFIAVTDCGKFGPFINITRDSSPGKIDSDIYNLSVLFGTEKSSYLAQARYIAESIEIDRPLLLTVTASYLKKEDLDLIIAAIKKLKTW